MKGFKRAISVILTVLLVLVLLAGCGTSNTTTQSGTNQELKKEQTKKDEAPKEVTLNVLLMKQAGYSEDDTNQMTSEFIKQNPNIKVNLNFIAYEELEPKITTSAKTGGYDVILGDCTLTAKYVEGGLLRDVTDKFTNIDTKDIFQGALDSVLYKGKYYGMPWLQDCKYLFYNKKMLKDAGFNEPPKTWEELSNQAKVIKEKGIVKYPIAWSWAQAEAIVCDFSPIAAAFGGEMINKDGKPVFTNEGNKKALDYMISTMKDGITNPKSTEFLENDVLATFQAGNSAFTLNWTYAYSESADPSKSKVSNDVGIALIPGSGSVKSATPNGGQPLAITSGSKYPEEAWKYIQFLTSKEMTKKFSKNALPIWKSLYDDKAVVDQNPEVVKAAKMQYEFMINRPVTPFYSEISTKLQEQLQLALLGKKSSDQALKEVQDKATFIISSK